jgi:serine/threonine protein kinase
MHSILVLFIFFLGKYEMLSGEQAFPVKEHDTESKFYGRITHGTFSMTSAAFKNVSKEAKDLISGMLQVVRLVLSPVIMKILTCIFLVIRTFHHQVDPKNRLSASECLKHPWITGMAHTDKHLAHLSDVQVAMKSRMEKRKAADNK